MNSVLAKDYKMALGGRNYWIELKNKYTLNEMAYLIICGSSDMEINNLAIKNLNKFLKRKYIRKALVVSNELNLDKLYDDSSDEEVYFEFASQEQLNMLIKYYKLSQFTSNIVCISMEEPFCNRNIINKEGITLNDYINDAIYV